MNIITVKYFDEKMSGRVDEEVSCTSKQRIGVFLHKMALKLWMSLSSAWQ